MKSDNDCDNFYSSPLSHLRNSPSQPSDCPSYSLPTGSSVCQESCGSSIALMAKATTNNIVQAVPMHMMRTVQCELTLSARVQASSSGTCLAKAGGSYSSSRASLSGFTTDTVSSVFFLAHHYLEQRLATREPLLLLRSLRLHPGSCIRSGPKVHVNLRPVALLACRPVRLCELGWPDQSVGEPHVHVNLHFSPWDLSTAELLHQSVRWVEQEYPRLF